MILGQQKAISSISFGVSLANSISSALPTSLERWANSKLLAALLQSNCGPSASHQQYLVMGHPHAIGSISFGVSLANSMSSALPTSLERWANSKLLAVLLWSDSGPTKGHWQHLTWGELGQFHVIGITYLFGLMGQLEAINSTASEQLWAISKSLAVSSYGPPPCYRQCCIGMILGQQEAIGSISFKESLANSMSSA